MGLTSDRMESFSRIWRPGHGKGAATQGGSGRRRAIAGPEADFFNTSLAIPDSTDLQEQGGLLVPGFGRISLQLGAKLCRETDSSAVTNPDPRRGRRSSSRSRTGCNPLRSRRRGGDHAPIPSLTKET